jgi:hypothetical protein
MSDSSASSSPAPRGHINWRRFGFLAVPAAFAVGGLFAGVASGAIPASLSVSGEQFKVSADSLHGNGFRQYSGTDTTADGTQIPIATSVIDSAELTNLCQSVRIGPVVLLITAGGGGQPVKATGLTIGMTSLSGDATFTNVQIGRDGGDVSGNKALQGTFAQSADQIDIAGLKQVATSTSAGTFTLTGFHLQVLSGSAVKECF